MRVSRRDIDDSIVFTTDGNFQDFTAWSVGLQWPWRDNIDARVGALYLDQAVKDEDRTFSFALDRIFGIGFGVAYRLQSGNSFDLNLNLLDTGESPIDTGDSPVRGRVVGENEDHHAITLDFTYHWK
jgi:long-chain fatty acid transport protein